ncbi:hypothetical protein N7540_004990 [Penicillium herquei]|nr:hypothetical protein N7540_004990 [Penicillium herquei]
MRLHSNDIELKCRSVRRIYLTVHLGDFIEGTASESAAKSLFAPLNDRLVVEKSEHSEDKVGAWEKERIL